MAAARRSSSVLPHPPTPARSSPRVEAAVVAAGGQLAIAEARSRARLLTRVPPRRECSFLARVPARQNEGVFAEIEDTLASSPEVDHVAGEAVEGLLHASDSVGRVWTLRAASRAVRSHFCASVSSGRSSETSGPIRCPPRSSRCSPSAMSLTKPMGSPRPFALPVRRERELRDLHVVPGVAGLLLGQTERGDLGRQNVARGIMR